MIKKLIKKLFVKYFKATINQIVMESEVYKNSKLLLEMSRRIINTELGNNSRLYQPYDVSSSSINDFTYIAQNSRISMTLIGKCCSIGPNFLSGYGIHPIDGISTSPMFYSTMKQNGISLSQVDKVEERKRIHIGNDIFIGANVIVLDGVTIGDGAVIGAGAVVSKDIPPYAIAIGCPIKIIKYRFDERQIGALLKIKWWDFNGDRMEDVEKFFFKVDEFIKQNINV